MADAIKLSGDIRKNDRYLIDAAAGALPFIYAYCQQKIEVVHGPSCKPDKEINLDRCAADNVAVAARRGGGGTVVLSPGMVITVVVGRRCKGESIHDVFSRIHRPMISLIKKQCGIALEEKGLSDIAAGDKKVLGSSLYLCNRPFLYLYQSSLMVDCDCTLMSRYLKHPPREPDYREGRPHEEFCTTLKQCGCRLNAQEIADLINNQLQKMIED